MKYEGLNEKQIIENRNKYGSNELEKKSKENILKKIISVLKEPMFLLLFIAASIYFLVGEYTDGLIMLIFVVGICTTEFIQENKTDKALEELNKLSSLDITVIRNGKKIIIDSKEIVKDDIVILKEGDKVPADGTILECSSLGVNESSLTGESISIIKQIKEDKENYFKKNKVYMGTNITSGYGIIKIDEVGINTEFGKIGTSLNTIKKEKTILEKQINKLIKICTIVSIIFFILVILVNYINSSNLILKDRIINSIISGITIAMATIPEEIPVVLTVFMAMGAWELSKKNTLTKNMKSIETLGAVTVLCTDKTGTITENKMKVVDTYEIDKEFNKILGHACPKTSFDETEMALIKYTKNIKKSGNLIHEYIFNSKNKMTGFIYEKNKNQNLYIKGAYENIIKLCNISDEDKINIQTKIKEFSSNGYRVLAIASKSNITEIKKEIKYQDLKFNGLVALQDPPRKGIKKSLEECYNAGIRVIVITGDNGETAKGIGNKIGLKNNDEILTGPELEKMNDQELKEKVKTINIFARVYPNHKMRIVEALQKNGEIVAMTGDGVNDATALKKSDIGISMGMRGTSVAKEASDLILLDDNFNTIVKSIKMGRTIYDNIKKAISYIIAIHIPIALLSLFIPLFKLPNMLLPIHVVLLELLIDPTSSIIFQRLKPNKNIMKQKPRNISSNIISPKRAFRNIMQGILIFLVVFISYKIMITQGVNTNKAITISYSTLVLSIILIAYELSDLNTTLINIKNSIKDKINIIVNILITICLLLIIYIPLLNTVANTSPIGIKEWLLILILSLIAVLPFDIFKYKKHKN